MKKRPPSAPSAPSRPPASPPAADGGIRNTPAVAAPQRPACPHRHPDPPAAAHPHPHHHPGDASGLVDAALRRLRKAGHRVTSQRSAMLRVLAASGPVSIETLHRALAAGTADPATVYRSILIFEQAGIVQAHPLENGARLYCLGGTAGHPHHHHVICRVCGRMEEAGGCAAEPFEAVAHELGYTEVSHVFEIYGVCPGCAATRHSA